MYCAYCGNSVAQVSYAPCPHCGNPTNGAPRRPASNTAGILIGVILGFFALIAFLGILAAIAIPNYLTAKARSEQKRTMAHIRNASTAVLAYATDTNTYPPSSLVDKLRSTLEPTYTSNLPAKDAWGHDLHYECWPAGECTRYAVGSPGKDGRWEHESLQEYAPDTKTTSFDADIVWVDDEFVQFPEGSLPE